MSPGTASDAEVASEAPELGPGAGAARSVVLVLVVCGAVMTLQQTMILPLLPALPSLLGTSSTTASWLVTATLVTGAVVTPLVGRLADSFGKKRLVMITLSVVVAGSLLGGVSASIPALIVARAMQGCGLALVPVAISIMRDVLPRDRVPGGAAAMGASLAVGSAAGLPIAGLVVLYLDWHGIFWVTAASGALLLMAVVRVIPDGPVSSRDSFDYLGAVVLAGALTSVLLVLTKGNQWGWGEPRTRLLLVVGCALAIVWVPVELRSRSPVVDLRLASRPAVLSVNTCSLLIGFALFSNTLVTIQQLQIPRVTGSGFGMGMVEAGLWMIPPTLVGVVMAPVAASAIRRFGARLTLLVAAVQISGSFGLRVFFSEELWQVLAGAGLVAVGLSLAQAAIPTLTIQAVPVAQTASANGVNALLRSVGTSSASATMAAVAAVSFVHADGGTYPSFGAFAAMFWISAGATLIAAGVVAAGLVLQRSTRTLRAAVDGAQAG
ncbi:MFS transporter [Rhodococcus sp. OK519]|nr:MFS transporter [Rhodococcus sp. OK519]